MNYMKFLMFLDFFYNELKVFSKRNMDDFNFFVLVNLIIIFYGNLLICMCDSVQFWVWLIDLLYMIICNVDYYKCVLFNGFSVVIGNVFYFVQELRKECIIYFFIIFGSLICVLVFLVIMIWKIIYRYCWIFWYWYYVLRSVLKCYKSYQYFYFCYDVYMFYDEEDCDVVLCLIEMFEIKK